MTSETSTTWWPAAGPPPGTGDIEVDGLLNLEDFTEETGITLPEGPYETVAGFVISRLGHVAEIDEHVEVDGHRLTVIECDGRRISRLRVSPLLRERPEPVVSPVAEPPAS